MFVKNLHIGVLLDFYGDILTERQRDILDMYYNDDLSLNEISENLGISRQGVRSAVKKGEEILTELEEKLGLYKRADMQNSELQKIISDIETLAEKRDDASLKDIANRIRHLSRSE